MIPLNQIGRKVAINARALSEVAIPYAKRNKANLAMMGGGILGAGFFNNRRVRDGGGAVNYGGMAAGLGLAAFGGRRGGVANLFSKQGINSLVRGSENNGIAGAARRTARKADSALKWAGKAPQNAVENWKPRSMPTGNSREYDSIFNSRGNARRYNAMGNRTKNDFMSRADINRGASSLLDKIGEWMGGGNL